MNTLTRQSFCNQHGQYLIIDNADMNPEVLNNLIKAVQNVLTLACSVRGGVRIPGFALSVLNTEMINLYEFDVIRGNYNTIVSALNSLPSFVNETIQEQDLKDSLYHAINSVIRTAGTSNLVHNIPDIEITFITTKNCQLFRSYIETFIENMEVTKICKIIIIEIHTQPNDPIVRKNDNLGFIQTIVMNGHTHLELEKHFKTWLLDKSSEIAAIIHFPGAEHTHLTLKCDILECLLNPLSLPFGHRVYITMDSLSIKMSGTSVAVTDSSSIPVYEFNIMSRVSIASICESNIFGLPMCLWPSQSWRLSVAEEQENRQLFGELCRQLDDAGQVLVVQLRSQSQTDFSPYFILTPGNGCLLMKSFASSDLILPWEKEQNQSDPLEEHKLKIYANLQHINLVENLNPNQIENGLLESLAANLKHGSKRDTSFDLDISTLKRFKRNNK